MDSFDEILQRMREAYREESGLEPEDVSDTGLRLRVLAGELVRLQAELGWIRRQAFPQTATGEALDMHGALRGVTRKEGTCAVGTITFARYLPLSFDLVISKGTVCAASGEDAVEYETTEDAVLPAGDLTVAIPAKAVLSGPGGNAAAGYVNTLVTPPNGIEYAINQAPFSGGADRESDEAYRIRVLQAYSRISQLGNTAYYEEAALSCSGVSQAQAVPRENGAGTVGVYVWGDGAAPSETVLSNVSAKLSAMREIGVTVNVHAASAERVNVTVRIAVKEGASFAKAKEDAEAALAQWFAGRKLGDPVDLAEIGKVVMNAAPVARLTFPMTAQDREGVPGVLPVAGTVTVEALT